MSNRQNQEEASGCLALVAIALVIGAVVAGLMSLAALLDPFSWMPSIGELWEDCEDSFETSGDECSWEARFPGIWVHAIANLLYVAAATGVLLWFHHGVTEFRKARARRFADTPALQTYIEQRQTVALSATCAAVVAFVPIVAAVV